MEFIGVRFRNLTPRTLEHDAVNYAIKVKVTIHDSNEGQHIKNKNI